MELRQELLEIERTLWTGGAEEYRRHLDEFCLVVFTEMAGVQNREAVAGMVTDGPRWQVHEMHPEGLLEPSPDVAVLAYRVKAERAGTPFAARVGSCYVRRFGEWRLAFHQQTPLPDVPSAG